MELFQTHPKRAASSSLSIIIYEMFPWQPAPPHLLMLAAQHRRVKNSPTGSARYFTGNRTGAYFWDGAFLFSSDVSAGVSCHFPSRPNSRSACAAP